MITFDYVPVILVCIFAGVTRTLIQESKRSISSFLSSVIMAVFVGYVTYSVLLGYVIKADFRVAICATTAFIADDLLLAVKAIGGRIRSNPVEALKLLLQKFIK